MYYFTTPLMLYPAATHLKKYLEMLKYHVSSDMVRSSCRSTYGHRIYRRDSGSDEDETEEDKRFDEELIKQYLKEYYKDASFVQRYFVYILFVMGVGAVVALLACINCCCCQRGFCCCCQGARNAAVDKYMLGAKMDSKGNIKYTSLTNAEIEGAQQAREDVEGFL